MKQSNRNEIAKIQAMLMVFCKHNRVLEILKDEQLIK